MRTVIETPTFHSKASKLWSETEYEAFIEFIAANPEAGSVIPATGGVRKVRWERAGKGKQGGVRIIYVSITEQGTILLIDMYSKSQQTNISNKDIRRLR